MTTAATFIGYCVLGGIGVAIAVLGIWMMCNRDWLRRFRRQHGDGGGGR